MFVFNSTIFCFVSPAVGVAPTRTGRPGRAAAQRPRPPDSDPARPAGPAQEAQTGQAAAQAGVRDDQGGVGAAEGG